MRVLLAYNKRTRWGCCRLVPRPCAYGVQQPACMVATKSHFVAQRPHGATLLTAKQEFDVRVATKKGTQCLLNYRQPNGSGGRCLCNCCLSQSRRFANCIRPPRLLQPLPPAAVLRLHRAAAPKPFLNPQLLMMSTRAWNDEMSQ